MNSSLGRTIDSAKLAVVCVDSTDTDNLELIISVIARFGIGNTAIVLTGRCALDPDVVSRRVTEASVQGIGAARAIPMNEWDSEFSELLLKVSALRFDKVIKLFGHSEGCPIYHGGLAAAPRVPHGLHMQDLSGFGDIRQAEIEDI